MENILGIVLGGIAAIVTAVAALVRALRLTDNTVRRENRGLHEWREDADHFQRGLIAYMRDNGLDLPNELIAERAQLQQKGREIDQGVMPE